MYNYIATDVDVSKHHIIFKQQYSKARHINYFIVDFILY